MSGKVKDPLAPIDFGASVLAGLVTVLVLIAVPATIFGSGSFLHFGEEDVCISVSTNDVPYGTKSVDVGTPTTSSSDGLALLPGGEGEYAFIPGLARGATASNDGIRLCSAEPTTRQHVLLVLADAPIFGYSVLLLFGLTRLIKRARRHGLFTSTVADGVRRLGWFVLLGTFVTQAINALCTQAILGDLVAEEGLDSWLGLFNMDLSIVLISLGMVTFGRVMAQTVPMREDLEATI